MTLRLILVRHAKSSWDDPVLSDHERPLNGRGQRAAIALGRWLNDSGLVPAQVLSSDSARTQETWARLSSAFDQPARPDWRSDLYHAGQETMMRALHSATSSPVLLLGHNPGCAHFAEMVVNHAPWHDRFLDYPTGATLVADFPIERWSDATWGQGQVVDFVIPKDLGVS